MSTVTYPVPSGTLDAYVAEPSTPGPWPGVVVVHEAFGLTEDMKRQADLMAEHGYLAIAPDLYSYGLTPLCLVATFRGLLSGGTGRATGDIDAARDYLVGRDDCSGKVGIIGFCMGGGFAILAANRGFDATAPSYGMAPKDLRAALAGACPVVASYGGKDRQLAGTARRLEQTLTELDIDHDVKEYADAGHSFMTETTGAWGWTERVPGLRYTPGSAQDAWDRVFTFFGRHLS